MNDFTKVTMIVAKKTGILGWKTSFHRRISLISYAYYLPLERSYLSLMSRTCDSVFQNPQSVSRMKQQVDVYPYLCC